MSNNVAIILGVWGACIACWVKENVKGWVAIAMTVIALLVSATYGGKP